MVGEKNLCTNSVVQVCEPLHLVAVHHGAEDSVDLFGTQQIEWRKVLLTGFLSLTAELASHGEASVSAGVIPVQFELLPRPTTGAAAAPLAEGELAAQMRAEREADADTDRHLFAAAKAWWRDYLQIRPDHAGRPVKLFARAEDGTNRPVCHFVRPLRAGRLLRSAGEAARFVSLLHHARPQPVGGGGGGGRSETWLDTHTVLASRGGDVEEHAVLLCSLLLVRPPSPPHPTRRPRTPPHPSARAVPSFPPPRMALRAARAGAAGAAQGFRLDAYVVVGTLRAGEPHTWVVTLDRPAPAPLRHARPSPRARALRRMYARKRTCAHVQLRATREARRARAFICNADNHARGQGRGTHSLKKRAPRCARVSLNVGSRARKPPPRASARRLSAVLQAARPTVAA